MFDWVVSGRLLTMSWSCWSRSSGVAPLTASWQGSIRRAKPGVSEWTLCNRRPANSFQRKTNRGLCDQR